MFQEVRQLAAAGKERAPAWVFNKEQANWLDKYTRQYRQNPGPGAYDNSKNGAVMLRTGQQHTPRYSIQHKKPGITPPWHKTPGPGEYAVYEGFFSPRAPVHREPFDKVSARKHTQTMSSTGKSSKSSAK